MVIHILRHGKTMANEKRLYCGSTDLPLSPGGIEELATFKAEGIYPQAGTVFISGLQRAGQTADVIYGDIQQIAVADLNEYDFGDFEMISYDDLKGRDDFKAWISDKTGEISCPGGESMNQFKDRVTRGFEAVMSTLQADTKHPALIVSHGGVIVSIMERLFPETHNYYEWQPATGRGYTIEFDGDEPKGYRKI